jgi:hypothetical protein
MLADSTTPDIISRILTINTMYLGLSLGITSSSLDTLTGGQHPEIYLLALEIGFHA